MKRMLGSKARNNDILACFILCDLAFAVAVAGVGVEAKD